MRRVLVPLVSALLAVGLAGLTITSAEAARKPVAIKVPAKQGVEWHGSGVIAPVVKKAKGVKITKKTVTVRQRGKVVRANAKRVVVRPGAYRVTTKVVYRHRGKKGVAIRTGRTVVAQGTCATRADFARLKTDPQVSPAVVGDSVATVKTKLRSSGQGETHTIDEAIELARAYRLVLKDLLGDIPEFWDLLGPMLDAEVAKAEGLKAKGVASVESRINRGCGGEVDVYTIFADGELYEAENDAGLMSGFIGSLAASQQPSRAAALASTLP